MWRARASRSIFIMHKRMNVKGIERFNKFINGKASASIGMLRLDECWKSVENRHARGLTLRVKKCGELAEGQSRP